jgi:3-oxoadipate enol-lactonase
MWDVQVAELEPGHRVIRCDLRGYGSTPLAAGDRYADARDVLELLDELGVDRFSVVAASYGGWVALQVASAAPERVERLVLLDPLAEVLEPDERLRSFWREEAALVEAGDLDGATELNVTTFLGPEASAEARELVRTMQRRVFELQAGAGDTENAELPVDLGGLTMPVTVVVGELDLPFFVDTARELARRLADAELIELPGAGHLPSLERPVGAALTG